MLKLVPKRLRKLWRKRIPEIDALIEDGRGVVKYLIVQDKKTWTELQAKFYAPESPPKSPFPVFFYKGFVVVPEGYDMASRMRKNDRRRT